MLTTLISTLTTPLRTIFSTEGIPCPYCRMLQSSLEAERELNRALLGLSQTPTTSPPSVIASSPPQESEAIDVLEGLPPEIVNELVREFTEERAKYPQNLTVNPDVPQIVPGQTVNLTP